MKCFYNFMIDGKQYGQKENLPEIIKKFLGSVTKIGGSQERCCSVLDSRSRDCGLEPHLKHCVVSLSKTIYTLQYWFTQENLS